MNETAATIVNSTIAFEYGTSPAPGDDLNVKRFTPIDLHEDKNPIFDDAADAFGAEQFKKVSLNSIVKKLQNEGGHRFSEPAIYKVSVPRKKAEQAL